MVTDPVAEVTRCLYDVMDPEIPFLNVMEMGMVREVVQDGDVIVIRITPTYSGCPATDVIAEDVLRAVTPKVILGHEFGFLGRAGELHGMLSDEG